MIAASADHRIGLAKGQTITASMSVTTASNKKKLDCSSVCFSGELSIMPTYSSKTAASLHIEVCDIESIVLDELAARFHHIAHQLGKEVVCGISGFDFDLQE